MARTLSADETRNEYMAVMGTELGRVFYELYNELAWLHLRWHQHVILFGTKPERVDLLNSAAGLFFRIVQDGLWEDTLLHLSRITDQVETGQRNLTIRLLPTLVSDPVLASEVAVLVDEATSKARFARDWRNRRIAHADLALAVKEGARPLAPASRAHVRAALAAVGAVVNRLQNHFKNGTIIFEPFGDPGDATSLLYTLREGLEAEEARRQRLHEGRPSDADLRRPRDV